MGLTIRYGEYGPVGYRVTKMVDGDHRQLYFKTDDYQSANAYHQALAEWSEREEEKLRQKRAIEAKPNTYTAEKYAAPRRTAVSGLSIDIAPARRNTTFYCYPCVIIQHWCPDSERTTRTRRQISPTTRTLYEAWRESCRLLASLRGVEKVPYAWYRAEPKPQQFVDLRDFMVAQGKNVSETVIEYVSE